MESSSALKYSGERKRLTVPLRSSLRSCISSRGEEKGNKYVIVLFYPLEETSRTKGSSGWWNNRESFERGDVRYEDKITALTIPG